MYAQLTIGQLGERVGVPTKTIRFYEEIGLISQAKRAENGYRTYPEKAVEELSLIKNARDMGLPIPQIKKLMKGCQDGDCRHTKAYITNEITAYLSTGKEKIAQLQTLQKQLTTLQKNVATDTSNTYCCNILEKLMEGGEKNG